MQDFYLYFILGWEHILDWQGYDHILFVTALCGVYTLADWKKILWLATAFTVGHSLTLALSVWNQLRISGAYIEFLIPLTIIITALFNISRKNVFLNRGRFNYGMALFFGLIHGLGFSNYLKSLLGKSDNIILELFGFNLGLEFGQLIIILVVLLLAYLVINRLQVSRREWNLFLSSVILGMAFIMALQRLPNL